ncbi:MAG: hypothetical protein ABSC37_00860 [Xanthobacteraceae bacterium]
MAEHPNRRFKISILYDDVVQFCVRYGGRVVLTDLTDVYARFPKPKFTQQVFYTGLSNGRTIYIHNDETVVDREARTWDVLHLTGHMLQWHMKPATAKRLGMKFYGNRAREYSAGDFFFAPSSEFGNILQYELEANQFSVSIAAHVTFGKQRAMIMSYLKQFGAKDLRFIMQYYNGFDESRTDKFVLPSARELERRIVPVKIPSSTEIRFEELPMLSVPVILVR